MRPNDGLVVFNVDRDYSTHLFISYSTTSTDFTSHTMSDDKLQITLYRGFPGSGIYTWSPFVTKIEARLRFAGISYRSESGSPRSAPRGKIPYVELAEEDGTDQRTLSDSAFIIKDFIENGYLDDINATLTPAEKTYDLGLRALLEDRLYFIQVCSEYHQHNSEPNC